MLFLEIIISWYQFGRFRSIQFFLFGGYFQFFLHPSAMADKFPGGRKFSQPISTISSETKTDMKFLPLCTAKVKPIISGLMTADRAQVLIGVLSPGFCPGFF